ncbi:MAG: hypothetical protein HQM06_17610 [Magnetococcales bacterium]|nr:hypothetical protein [Magnetococcales bacterium]
MMTITFICYWRNKTSHGNVRATIESTVPLKHLKGCRRIASRLEGATDRLSNSSDQSGCLDQLMIGLRTHWFMQATGFKHSQARSIIRVNTMGMYERDFHLKEIDHQTYWRTPEGALIMANEPYCTFDKGPWDPLVQVGLPRGHGMWYPPATKLFLLAVPEHGQLIEQARDQLIAAGLPPVPEMEIREWITT